MAQLPAPRIWHFPGLDTTPYFHFLRVPGSFSFQPFEYLGSSPFMRGRGGKGEFFQDAPRTFSSSGGTTPTYLSPNIWRVVGMKFISTLHFDPTNSVRNPSHRGRFSFPLLQPLPRPSPLLPCPSSSLLSEIFFREYRRERGRQKGESPKGTRWDPYLPEYVGPESRVKINFMPTTHPNLGDT